METEDRATKCWNAYLESHGGIEPQSVVDFWGWHVNNAHFGHTMSYSQSYDIYDEYSGKGEIEDVQTIQISQPPRTRNARYYDNLEKKKQHSQPVPRPSFGSQTPPVISRTQAITRFPYHNRKPKAHTPTPKQRQHTLQRKLKSDQKHVLSSGNSSPSDHDTSIKTVAISPNDDLALFFREYDIQDLSKQLSESRIGLMHLESLEAADLNELCAYLKLSITEKIRFKFAVKDIQQKKYGRSASNRTDKSTHSSRLIQSHSTEYVQAPALLSDDEDATIASPNSASNSHKLLSAATQSHGQLHY
eukprot:104833_1